MRRQGEGGGYKTCNLEETSFMDDPQLVMQNFPGDDSKKKKL